MTDMSYDEANRMLTINDDNLTYDLNGNLIQKGDTTYVWDARNRLVQIISPSMDASFKYDALNRRIEKTINGITTQYLYDGLDIIQEIEDGMVTVNYIRSLNIDEPLARLDMLVGVRFYHTDALGSVIALTDEMGEIKTQYNYTPFGTVETIGEESDNPFQYTGRENDGTGLMYYRARYYSPEMKRFISEDPIGFRGGVNFYSYVGNGPINATDPLGLAANITIAGNYVYIEIPITYTGKGATASTVKKFNQGIENAWSGKFGKYNVKTTVTQGPDNIINVPVGNGTAKVFGTNRGEWPSARPPWTAAHEAGHLMGLPDRYNYQTIKPLPGYAGNIMGQRGGIPSTKDISDIISKNPTQSIYGPEPSIYGPEPCR